jgi:Cu2+-exporting ATPase
VSSAAVAADTLCLHCGLPTASGRRFCCAGCAAAYDTIQHLGLGRYYEQRLLDPAIRAPRPEAAERWDLARHIATQPDGTHALTLALDGLQCGACVWLIEQVLAREPNLLVGRVNMTTRVLRMVWRGEASDADRLVATVERLGYRLVPFDAAAMAAADDRTGRALLRALAVAGFASANVMFNSIAVWAGFDEGMGPATRGLLYWVSALIAMPAVAYAGLPFFRSAWSALRARHTNMDVPVSIGVLLVSAMSLWETVQGGRHTYFDSVVTLLFFLLIGRVMDHRARGQARATAQQLLTLRATEVAVLAADGSVVRCPQESVAPGARVLVGMGERIGVDGVVERGNAPLDASLVTGESLPVQAGPGTRVFAGTLNQGATLLVCATATGAATLLAECVRLIEAAEARRGRFVILADRVARLYAPVVHCCAAAAFAWWWGVQGLPAADALLIACAVLIITCPCALALAVPAVQVVATGALFRAGILLKSATALERLAEVDTVVFDKTGTLTEPTLALVDDATRDPKALLLAASLAARSRHPLSRSLLAATGPVPAREAVEERPGEGLLCGEIRLGARSFAGDPSASPAEGPELWLARPGRAPFRFAFHERLRADAVATLAALRRAGLSIMLASGDRAAAVCPVAATLGIADWRAEVTPTGKVALMEALLARGHRVLMVGDGLNDGPSLAAASVSMSPATAADISQTVADIIFQGRGLAAVDTVLRLARRARTVMRSLCYNVVMLPLAMAGLVTPWLAAAAMSASSLLVMANSFRARPWKGTVA